jgi:hypothetical protein
MKKIVSCIFSHEITKGMKSYGPIALLKAKKYSYELIYYVIKALSLSTKYVELYIVFGFEEDRIKKRLSELNIKNQSISNTMYETTNFGYAFKLLINQLLLKNTDNINGFLFINGNIILKKMPKYPTENSWLLMDKKGPHENSNIGCQISHNIVDYVFYDIGKNAWTETFFLTKKDLLKIHKNQQLYHNNMFSFEIINTAIEKQKIEFKAVYLDNSCDFIKINGIKDKNKIKI